MGAAEWTYFYLDKGDDRLGEPEELTLYGGHLEEVRKNGSIGKDKLWNDCNYSGNGAYQFKLSVESLPV